MSETLLETAQTPNEAVTTTTPAAEATPVAETKVGEQQQASSEQPAAAAATEAEKPAEQAKPAEPAKPEGAPEKYEFTAPEGQTYDARALMDFGEAARAANLPQDAAQKLLDAMAPKLAARQVEQVAAIHRGWMDAVVADKEIGGEVGSAPFIQKMGIARKFVANFDQDGALGKLLEDTGLGNHPAVLRVFYRAGKAISEDTVVSRGNREGGAVNPLDVLYPTNKKE